MQSIPSPNHMNESLAAQRRKTIALQIFIQRSARNLFNTFYTHIMRPQVNYKSWPEQFMSGWCSESFFHPSANSTRDNARELVGNILNGVCALTSPRPLQLPRESGLLSPTGDESDTSAAPAHGGCGFHASTSDSKRLSR